MHWASLGLDLQFELTDLIYLSGSICCCAESPVLPHCLVARFTANCSELPRVVGSAAYMDLMRSYPELAQKFVRLAAEMQAEAGRTAEAANSRRKKKRRR